MKCALCGLVFDEKKGASACAHCPLVSGCRLIRCPHCGFETPAEPEWLRRLFGKSSRSMRNHETHGIHEMDED